MVIYLKILIISTLLLGNGVFTPWWRFVFQAFCALRIILFLCTGRFGKGNVDEGACRCLLLYPL